MITKRHKVCSSFSRMLGTEQVLNTFCCLPTLPLRYQTSLQFLSILLTFSLLKLYHLLLRILGSHSEVTYFSCIPLSVSILSSSFLSAPKQIISGALSSLLLFFLSVFFFFFFPTNAMFLSQWLSLCIVTFLSARLSIPQIMSYLFFLLFSVQAKAQHIVDAQFRFIHFIVSLYVFSSCIPPELSGKTHIVHSASQTQHAQNESC